MRNPIKNWKVYLRGLLTISLILPTTWPIAPAVAAGVQEASETSNCSIGYNQKLHNFVAEFNKKYPQEEVQINQIHQVIGKDVTTQSFAKAYDDPELKVQAAELINFLYEKCAAEDNKEFTGIIYDLMTTQLTMLQEEGKIVDSFRPMQMLLSTIGSQYFTPKQMVDRQKNRDDYIHNVIEWSPWVGVASIVGAVIYWKRNPIKAWKDAHFTKRFKKVPIETEEQYAARMLRKDAIAWWKSEYALKNPKMLPNPRNSSINVDENGYAYTRQINPQNIVKRKSHNYDEKSKGKYSPTSGLPGHSYRVKPGDTKEALEKRLRDAIKGKLKKTTTSPAEAMAEVPTKKSEMLTNKLVNFSKDIAHAFKTKQAWITVLTFAAASGAAGYGRQWLYQNDIIDQLPLDMDAKLDEQNFMLALDVHCHAQSLKREVTSRDYKVVDKFKVPEDAKAINKLAVAYSMIIRPDQILKNPNAPVTSSAAWTFGGKVPDGILWSEESGVATSSFGSEVSCPTKKGLAKDKIAPNNEDSKKLIDEVATFYVNHVSTEKLSRTTRDTDVLINNISNGVMNNIRQDNNQLRQEYNYQLLLKDKNAKALSDFDYLFNRITNLLSNNENKFNLSKEELHNQIIKLRPKGDYSVIDKVVSRAASMSAHEYNRWLLQLFWRFVKFPQERVAIYLIWTSLANKNYESKKAIEELSMTQDLKEQNQESIDNNQSQRLNYAALILSLVHGDALLQPSQIEIPLFSIPEANKNWEWSVKVARSIEGNRGFLNDAQTDLQLEWTRSPLIELAAKNMSGTSSVDQDESFYQRWILGAAFDQGEDMWSLPFKKTLMDLLPQFSNTKLDAETLFPLFVHLSINRLTCNSQEMVGIINNSFDPAKLEENKEEASQILENEAQKIALRLQPGRSSLVDNFEILSNISALTGGHDLIGLANKNAESFACQIRDTQSTGTVHPSADLEIAGEVLYAELQKFIRLQKEYNKDLLSTSESSDDIPPPPETEVNEPESNL
ncbi:MAG: hypothetical protein KDD58_10915 [Bdellovibrionales bacterium]|nr:hypothetical protein [Bdellovibrionales bacterium]